MSKIENWWLSVRSLTWNNWWWTYRRICVSRKVRLVRDTLYCQPGDRFHPAPLKLQGVLIARRSHSSIVSDDCRQSARQLERRSRWRSDKSDVTSRQRSQIHEDVIVSLNIARFAEMIHDAIVSKCQSADSSFALKSVYTTRFLDIVHDRLVSKLYYWFTFKRKLQKPINKYRK